MSLCEQERQERRSGADSSGSGEPEGASEPYKYFGPHMGLAFGKRELLESWRAYKVQAGRERARRSPLRARHEPARAARGLRRGGRLHGVARLGRDARRTSARSASASSPACRRTSSSTASARMDGRVPTFCFNVHGPFAGGGRALPRRARRRRLARRLLRGRDDEVPRALGRRRSRGHRPLQHRGRGRPPARRVSPRSREAAPPRRPEIPRSRDRRRRARARPRADVLQPRHDEPGSLSRGRADRRRSRRRPQRRSRGRTWDAVIDTSGYLPSDVRASAEALAGCGLYCFVSSISVYADFARPNDEDSPVAELGDLPGRRGDERELRSAQGALRGRRARGLRRARARRSTRAHRRTARSDRPLHVLAASHRARRRGARTRSSRPPDAGDRRARSRRVDRRALRARIARGRSTRRILA